MKHKLIGGLAVAALLVLTIAWTPVHASSIVYSTFHDAGTRTHKFHIETDSLQALGGWYTSTGSLKTRWVAVPVGIDFTVFVQGYDADSTKCFGPDTIGINLETAPMGSLAYDSATSTVKYDKADLLWNYRSLVWWNWDHGIQKTLYGGFAYADTTTDTVSGGIQGRLSKTGEWRPRNLGLLRFSVCVDAADSVLDQLLRVDAYIIYSENPNPTRTTYGDLSPGDIGTAENIAGTHKRTWAVAEVPEGARYVGTFRAVK